MLKTRLAAAVLGLVFVTGTAFAMGPDKPMAQAATHCHVAMRRGFFHHPTVPMLLPFAEMHSYQLHLSDHQVSALAVWHNRHMQIAVPLMKRLRGDKRALHEALLRGDGRGVIRDIEDRLDRDRAHMLKLAVAQVRIVHKTLSLDQWHQLLHMYRRMPAMGFGMMRH